MVLVSAQPYETDSRVSDATAIRMSLRSPESFAAIFDRHFDAVYGYTARRLGRDLGEEVAAETFARAFDLRGRYDLSYPDSRPWLFGIASNILRRHWRSERRRLEAHAELASQASLEHQGPAEVVSHELASAIQKLPHRQREALLLYALGELSYEEISRAVGAPIGTVRSRLARARRHVASAARLFEQQPTLRETRGKESSDA
jgi:RNA polymerase sigma factor (sigma-70 family)